MNVSYEFSVDALCRFADVVRRLAGGPAVQRVCELGAGAKPLLSLEFLAEHALDCVLVDISPRELAKAPDGYVKVVADAASDEYQPDCLFDLVFSRVVAEHVADPRALHQNVWRLLRPGGQAAHFFPTLYWPPFVVNRVLPEGISSRLLRVLQPGREPEGHSAKFPAYYRWCRGPLRRQVRRLEATGFEVEEYGAFFGQLGYWAKLPPLAALDRAVAVRLVKRPMPWLTSYAYVVLRKDGS